jgi:branched-chain amino acid transport system substrate-binding protein
MHRDMGRKIAAGLACAAAAIGVAACGGGDTSDSSGGDTVTFGANTELSGSLQIYGLPAVQGMELAADDINSAGGIEVGDTSSDLAIVKKDNRSDPSAIVSSARDVVDAGAIAALGPDLGGKPSYEVFKENDVITLTPAFDLQLQLLQDPAGNPLLFSPTVFLAELYEINMRQVTAAAPDIKTVAILAPNDEQGQGTAAAYDAAAKKAGLTVVGNETYPVGNTDFTSVLTQFKQEQPDLLIAEQTSEQATAILQQAVQLGVAPYALNDVATPDQIQKVPGIEKMTVFISNFSPTFSPNATIPDYHPEEIFGDQQPAGNPGAAINMYYVTYMLKQAMEQAGTTTDAAKIAAALPGQSYDGPFGTCEMTERQAVDCETILDVVKGDEITVYRFPGPEAEKPSDTYICRGGTCEAQ